MLWLELAILLTCIVIVRASRVPTGSVGRKVDVDDDKYGFVVSGELSPSKARVLLKLALLKTNDPGKIQALFDKY
jgi:L-asparaginase